MVEETVAGEFVAKLAGKAAAVVAGHSRRSDVTLGTMVTADTARALRVADRIESGICHINGPTVHDEANMPFGGVQDSGYGRFGDGAAIAEFTDLRWITIPTCPRHYSI